MNAPSHMAPHDMQETNERRFARKHINGYIDTAIRDYPANEAKVEHGIRLLNTWRGKSYFPSKDARLAQLADMDMDRLVRDIYVGIAYCKVPTLFVSITAQLAHKLGFDDHKDSIRTVAEMVAVLSEADAFDLTKENAQASIMVTSKIPLPMSLYEAMERSLYLPPMVCMPLEIKSNYESPYLTFNESQILGRGNSHLGDICLDVINTQNQIPLRLATDFLSTVEEEPSYPLDTLEKLQHWKAFKQHSYEIYDMLAHQGNQFWLTHKVDKRGRLYAAGYHINSQGSAFKKASLELYNEETVNGVPT